MMNSIPLILTADIELTGLTIQDSGAVSFITHRKANKTFECAECERECNVILRTQGRPNVCTRCSNEQDRRRAHGKL